MESQQASGSAVTQGAPAVAGARPSVWGNFGQVLSLGNYSPALREDLTWARLKTRRGEPYAMLSDRSHTYLRLSQEDDYLAGRMDGSRTVSELVVDYFHEYGRFGFDHVAELVTDLRRSGLLQDPPRDIYADLQSRLHPAPERTHRGRMEGSLLMLRVPWRGIDRLVTRIYDRVGWLLFTPPVLLVSVAVAAVGLLAFIAELRSGRDPFAPLGSSHFAGLVALVVAFYAVIFIHESSHALTCKHWGRRVDEGGFMLYFFLPAFFVNVTDVWLEPWHRRLRVFAAGPYSGFVLAGLSATLVWFLPGTGLVTLVLFKLAVACYLNVGMNLVPFLRFDGYYILEEWLEVPHRRDRALAFVRGPMWQQLLDRQPLSRGEVFYGVFGALSATYSVFSIFLAALYWRRRLNPIVRPLWLTPGFVSKAAAAALIGVVGVPLGIRYGRRLWRYQRALRRAPATAKKALAQLRLRERLRLLRGVAFLERLPAAGLERLARAGRVREVGCGVLVVRQGERGDEFFLIAQGEAEVLVRERGDDRTTARLGPGDFFGERALLGSGVRGATVRAVTPLKMLVFGHRAFWTELAAPVTWETQLRAALAERQGLEALPLLADATPRQLDLLAVKLKVEPFQPGDVLVRQGDPGEAFYIIREGKVEVLLKEDGRARRVSRLGPGDYFGEIALLRDVPRTATVRATEAGSVWRLERQDFRELLGRYLELEEQLGGVADSRLPRGHSMAGAA